MFTENEIYETKSYTQSENLIYVKMLLAKRIKVETRKQTLKGGNTGDGNMMLVPNYCARYPRL